MTLKSKKEGKYLVFEFEDGKNVKYDLSNGQTIGKLGKPVQSICTQLRGYKILDVIDSFEDENYKRFLSFVDKKVNKSTATRYTYTRVEKIRNLGTFLNHIREYSKYEQIFSAGIKNISSTGLDYTIKQIPKGLIKLCKDLDLTLTNGLIKTYVEMPNEINTLMTMEFNSIHKTTILEIFEKAVNSPKWIGEPKIIKLIKRYNYKVQNLFTYFDYLITYEAIERINDVINEFYDYVHMSNKLSPKYERYPRNLLTTHAITVRNYNRLKTQFDEEQFQKCIDKTMEYTYENYSFIYPNTTQEIKDEAVQQNNCVASYIQRVLRGECHILFMRDKDELNKSLVTIEVRQNKIVQYKGKFNRDCTPKEVEAIKKWNEYRQNKIKLLDKKENVA